METADFNDDMTKLKNGFRGGVDGAKGRFWKIWKEIWKITKKVHTISWAQNSRQLTATMTRRLRDTAPKRATRAGGLMDAPESISMAIGRAMLGVAFIGMMRTRRCGTIWSTRKCLLGRREARSGAVCMVNSRDFTVPRQINNLVTFTLALSKSSCG